jgi:hypothetical protein
VKNPEGGRCQLGKLAHTIAALISSKGAETSWEVLFAPAAVP